MSLRKPVAKKKPPKGSLKSIKRSIKPNKKNAHRDAKGVPKFRSGFEREFWDANHSKIALSYEPFTIDYSIIEERKYKPDFVDATLFKQSSKIRVYETKGRFTGVDRKKLLAVRETNPEIELILVFQRDNKLTTAKNSSRYSEWATKHGFDYCIGTDLSKIVYASNPNRVSNEN